ncbi:MAG: UDP-N-acetylglucosamine--N-acetylmuramyl-(pentapeptide) pyrophosphoryl-undecaprenol N-acetylglucosamine transferase [Parachlamydiaceae bacterium]|nr:UDP-N-acetylglucosamine--N-acetylmuramyl-(pentapeptide) pyrophosphoryl-undecaprenol N-acetylglucosamine transferase [Parachlamydiaceae bacterium]
MRKKILIAAGGTGGHIYPAMGFASGLLESDSNLDIMFVAGGLLESPFFDRTAFAWNSVSSAALSKKNPLQFMKSCGSIARGFWQSSHLLSSYKPNLVVGFGSYHSFPVLSAAQLQGYPIVLHEQNSKPGKVIRLFSKQALLTGIYFPDAAEKIHGKTSLLTMPLRKGFSKDSCSKVEACSYFQLDSQKMTLLVFGGSLGAQFLNKKIAFLLASQFSQDRDFQVLHFAGKADDAEQVTSVYEKYGVKATVKVSETRMDFAWRAADLAIVRSGAGTIAEQIEFEVPALFFPYPHAAEDHQNSNADFVVEYVKGGWKFQESEWELSKFSALLQILLNKKSPQLREKQHSLSEYKKKSSRKEFTWVIHNLLKTL